MDNKNCPGVKRLMREAAELAQPTEHYHAAPLEDNLFEWHFTVRGQAGTSFEGGVYHGRIIFPPQYPHKPPSVLLLTPNGRFEINRKICLSISDHHPETWQPSWSIRTVLLAIVGFMPTEGKGAIGALDWTDAERKKLARGSLNWSCKICGRKNAEVLLPVTEDPSSAENYTKETEKYAAELSFSADKEQASKSEQPKSEETAATEAVPDSAVPSNPAPVQPPASEPAPVNTVTVTPTASPSGGVCSLMLIYLLVTLISALFLRRVVRTIQQEYLDPEI